MNDQHGQQPLSEVTAALYAETVCTCGHENRRGPGHAGSCPVFQAWSLRDADLRAENDRLRQENQDLLDSMGLSLEDLRSRDSFSQARQLLELRAQVERLTAELVEARDVARYLHRLCERDPHLLHGGMQPEHPWLNEQP